MFTQAETEDESVGRVRCPRCKKIVDLVDCKATGYQLKARRKSKMANTSELRSSVIEFCRGITEKSDLDELLDFTASVTSQDIMLGTVMLIIHQQSGGSVANLYDAAKKRKAEPPIKAMIEAFAEIVRRGMEYYSLAADIASEAGKMDLEMPLRERANRESTISSSWPKC